MITLASMGLPLRWGIANSVARIIKVISNATWCFNFIANSVTSVVIYAISGAGVIGAVIHVVWAITHVVR